MRLLDQQGREYDLGKELGSGGEATIYRITSSPVLVAKIYKSPRPDYLFKLAAMRDAPPDDPSASLGHTSIAWVKELLFTIGGDLSGYLMPYIPDAVPLIYVLNRKLRQQKLPGFDEKYLLRAARNLCAAVGAIHYRDYVIGDLNESNILIKSNTLITIIDTDSFQVRAPNRHGQLSTYPCPVGKPEYTAPEFQGKQFTRTRRTEDSDHFALGVLVFQLLMDGAHPFRSQWVEAGEAPALPDRIQKGWFPYHKRRGMPVAPPENTLPLDSLHPEIQDLVLKCFVEGHKNPESRPSSYDWEETLARAEKTLKSCSNGHLYSPHRRKCPRCEFETGLQSKPLPSPISSTFQPTQETGTVSAAWRGLFTLPIPGLSIPLHFTLSNLGQRASIGAAGGLIVGILLGAWSGTGMGGLVTGGVAAFTGGALLSETINHTIGWNKVAAVLFASLFAFSSFQLGGTPAAIILFGGLGGILGWLMGRFSQQRGWLLAAAVACGVLGAILGEKLAGAFNPAWLSSGLTGAVSGAVAGTSYHFWRIYSSITRKILP